MIKKFIQSIFNEPTPKIQKSFLIVDGDQGVGKEVINNLLKPHPNWNHIWVQNKNAFQSKALLGAKHIEIVNPSNYGKESTDTYIAMEVVRICYQESPREVVILSNDADFIDVGINAALMFPKIPFVLMINKSGCATKDKPIPVLPSNLQVVKFRLKK